MPLLSPMAQYLVGLAKGKDDSDALIYFRGAAEAGDSDAQFTLGKMYENGDLIPQESSQMVRLQLYWYTLAAENGHAEAQYNLGLMYAKGEGVPQDHTEAVNWYRLAAEQGDADAAGAWPRD